MFEYVGGRVDGRAGEADLRISHDDEVARVAVRAKKVTAIKKAWWRFVSQLSRTIETTSYARCVTTYGKTDHGRGCHRVDDQRSIPRLL